MMIIFHSQFSPTSWGTLKVKHIVTLTDSSILQSILASTTQHNINTNIQTYFTVSCNVNTNIQTSFTSFDFTVSQVYTCLCHSPVSNAKVSHEVLLTTHRDCIIDIKWQHIDIFQSLSCWRHGKAGISHSSQTANKQWRHVVASFLHAKQSTLGYVIGYTTNMVCVAMAESK